MKIKLPLLFASLLLPLAALHAQSNYATPYTFTTFAGLASGPGSVDGSGASVRFDHPASLTVDASGNIYVADTNNDTVRKITSGGAVSTFAGTAGSVGSADGTGAGARFSSLNGAAVDTSGNVYIADTGNHTIRKITSGGVVTTLAGSPGSIGTSDGTGSAARFFSPFGVAVDTAGNVYVADTYNSTIRKITSGGVVTTLAGSAGALGSLDGTGSAARFFYPTGLTVDGSGNVYVADTYNNTIRKITSGGVVTTLAGSPGTAGSLDGTGNGAQFNNPYSVVVDGAGNLFVADTTNNTVRKVTAAGVVTTFAGTAGTTGSADGTGAAARFRAPAGVAVDGSGNVYVSDSTNDTIRKITSGGVVTTLAGSAVYQSADGTGGAARFTFPFSVATDTSGNVYVADAGNNTVRKITPAGAVTTLAGTAGSPGSADGTGAAARFNYPVGVTLDGSNNVYVADAGNNTVRKITSGGVVTTLAGLAGSPGSTDGTGSAARFSYPSGVAVDGSGNVYVADAGNNTVRKITSGGVVTTVAGLAGSSGSTDGTGSAARFNYPSSVALDGSGNVYVTDVGNNTIRKIASGGVVTTFAGAAGAPGSTDGTGSIARFSSPRGVALDAAGNVYVADFGNSTIRRISPAGAVTTLGGLAGSLGTADGTGSGARFHYPAGVAVNASGVLYVADYNNNTIRKGVAGGSAADFNGDGQADIILENMTTAVRGFWLMNGTSVGSWVYLGVVGLEWHVVATGDFNGDGQTDLLWENTVTGDTTFWLMNGTSMVSSAFLTTLPSGWRIAGAADFNADGKPDLVLENTSTGIRGFWLMNGTTVTNWVLLSGVAPEWKIVATGDFNADGKNDLLWENTVTGDRAIWLLNDTAYVSGVYVANVPTAWHITGAADYNADGKPDILWENTSTGDRVFWMMDGTALTNFFYLGNVSTEWHILP